LTAGSKIRWFSAIALAALAAGAGSATAAVVKIEEATTKYEGVDAILATLRYRAAKGEDNRVKIEIAEQRDRMLDLRVVDNGAPLQAGAGCTSGGNTVHCLIHEPRYADVVPCGGKGCALPVPGTRSSDFMRINLGDGDDIFHGAHLTGILQRAFHMTVKAGPGNDWIKTGGGDDTIDPGSGFDRVHSEWGEDHIDATRFPDGPDVYDLGGEVYNPSRYGADEVDYSRRSTPVRWNGFKGVVEGEGDKLNGVETVVGGSGDDFLRGDEAENFIRGGRGDDVILGEYNFDEILGGSGADTLYGGLHPDVLEGGAGNDRAFGGPDFDAIKLGMAVIWPSGVENAIGSDAARDGTGAGVWATGSPAARPCASPTAATA
jgi:RTX calcium-binding nonapeptide repeat (4 copies)